MAITVGLTVTRTELALSNLTSAAGVAEVVAYDPGGLGKRRVVRKSPTVAGHVQTGSVADSRLLVLTLRLFGSSKTLLDANVQTWLNAFSQTAYTVTLTVNGVAATWACDDADIALANDGTAGVDKFRLMAAPMRQIYEFRIPTQPYPTAGVF